MDCVYLVDESPCGDDADPYMNFWLCEEHTQALRNAINVRTRASALQAAKIHPLESFPGWCYVVLLPDGNVKIGYSNTEVLLKKRFQVLSREYGAPVVPLAVIAGGFVAEAVLHQKFNNSRLPGLGERFSYSAEMAEYIASVT